MRAQLLAMAALMAAFCVSGCRLEPIPQPTPPPIATPSPVPTETPPVLPMHEGSLTLRFSGLDRAPLTCRDDVQILATLTGEMEGIDRSQPVIELDLMGNTSAACPARPCNRNGACDASPDLMGLRVRYTADIDHDAGEPDEEKHLGEGMNYHHRLALGPLGPGGTLDVRVVLNGGRLTVETPVDAWTVETRAPMWIGRVVLGAPWKRRDARAWGWDAFSAHRWAAFEIQDAGDRQ